MNIDHIHFFVDDAPAQRDWFAHRLGWEFVEHQTLRDRIIEVLRYRDTHFVLSSPRTSDSPIADYLRAYAPGVVDIAIEVDSLTSFLDRPNVSPQVVGSQDPQDVSLADHALRDYPMTERSRPIPPSNWTRIAGWGRLCHTIIERKVPRPSITSELASTSNSGHRGIDHIVLNVPKGELQAAIAFYQRLFNLQQQQSFNIQTEYSGLNSQVLLDPETQLYFNINEPTSHRSQIQTFIEANCGAGIQHIALHSDPIVPTVAALRQKGTPLLSVPKTYYQHLRQRWQTRQSAPISQPISPQEWQQIVNQHILLDWQPKRPDAMLLQIFSQPIFKENHFFLEFIERRHAVQGFGEGNFLALYQAIEADMMRSPLTPGATL